MKNFTFTAMGSRIFIAIDTDEPQVFAEAQKAKSWFEEWEQVFSRFRMTSELSEINRHPGVSKKTSDVFFEMMETAQHAEKLSDGLVTPSILNGLLASGYTDDFEKLIGSSGWELKQALFAPIQAGPIEFNRQERTVTLPFGTQIDFGGIAKGWAAHQTMLRLSEHCPVLVDAGGDIAISGRQKDGSEWPIGVTNPFEEGKNLELLMVEGGGVATSGKDYRRWIFNGEMKHHIIDPRTMHPAETDILAATVLAENVMDAEVYAKTALILGSERGKQWLDNHHDARYLLVLDDGTLVKNSSFIRTQWNELWQSNLINQSTK